MKAKAKRSAVEASMNGLALPFPSRPGDLPVKILSFSGKGGLYPVYPTTFVRTTNVRDSINIFPITTLADTTAVICPWRRLAAIYTGTGINQRQLSLADNGDTVVVG